MESSGVEKRKRVSKDRHKWTELEELAILSYARELFLDGKDFEKPTAPEYYKRFQAKTTEKALSEMPVDKIIQHMKSIKKSYLAAIQFRKNTGEGILETNDNSEDAVKTVEEHIKRICKYFDLMDELLGDKPQFAPPCTMDSVVLDISDYDDAVIHDIIEVEASVSPCNEQPNEPEKIGSPPQKKDDAPKRKRNTPIKNASSALESAMRYRCIADENRLDWEKKCRNDDRLAQDKELELKSHHLDFEKQKWLDEFNFRKKTQEDAVRLEEMKLQKEIELKKLELQRDAELKKFELEKKFEIEKLKIQAKSE